MLGFILFIMAYVLYLPATIINFLIVSIKNLKFNFNGYFKDSAYRLDVYACGEFRTMWNVILIKKTGILFKKDGKTMSYYLGANLMTDSLTGFGKVIVWILNYVDPGHCLRAFILNRSK